jgi:hypothetical protein
MLINLAVGDRFCYHTDMSCKEFIQAQERIGCTGAQLARWMGLSTLTITRYRTGAAPVPGPVSLAMKALASGWRPE